MTVPVQDLGLCGPELFLVVLAVAVLGLDLTLPAQWRRATAACAGFGLLAAMVPVANLWGRPPAADFFGTFLLDNLALLFKLVFLAAGGLTVLLAVEYFGEQRGFGEFFVLLVFFVLALCLMASAGELMVLYLAFELSSLTGYLMAAWLAGDAKSSEAGLKYFIYGATASAVMLYGLSLLYGLTGSLHLEAVAERLLAGPCALGAAAAALVLAGMGYKIAMAPFHWWVPDVYEGAPTPVTAFLSVGPKLAGFAVLARLLQVIASTAPQAWPMALAVLATLTMFTGNLLALRQSNVKRMLAYSSIAHAGYLLIGVVVATQDALGLAAVAVYAVAYLFMNLGAFAVVLAVEGATGSALVTAFAGLGQQAPSLAAAMVLFLLSLTGIPPTAGFVGKLLLFGAAIKSTRFAWLAGVGIVNSAISLYYYMKVARMMYFAGPQGEGQRRPAMVGAALWGAIGAALLGTLPLGMAPQTLLALAQASAYVLAGR
jgi:NADH-quinone oxidoreductase subunit N